MTTLYLAGPMTGIPQFNFPAFDAAAADLRGQGYTIQSPAEMDDPATRAAAMASPDGAPGSGSTNGETWGDFLARDVKIISDMVDGVVVMEGVENSRGGRLEVFVARLCGLPVYRYAPGATPIMLPDAATETRVVDPTTGGEKDTKAQRMGLLPFDAMLSVSEVYGFGTTKYAAHNWRKGYAWGLSFDALQRHLAAFWSCGEDRDPESGLPHLAHAAFHVLALLVFSTQERYAELDDRAPC